MLEFPLHDGFFPQITLTREEVKYYKRLGKERVTQLIRIIEDAECAYKWTSADAGRRRHRSRLPRHARLNLDSTDDVTVSCQRASFLDFQPANKSAHASTLLKASVQISDTKVDEILRAVAKVKTKDFRKALQYMHGDNFVDARTLFTFPQRSACSGSDASPRAPSRESYSYRAIKWHASKTKTQRPRHGEDEKVLDFCFLEYAGKKKPHPGSNVVGFCVQESISREREVPTLESFGIARGYLSRMGTIISKTHQPNTFTVTSVCQIDGDLNPIVRNVLEELMQKTVCAVAKIPGLVARQRVSSLRFVEEWQWVPNSDRKACAVCLRGFYFRRKHHCRTCGEVVCSSCALLRELEEPIFDITHLRVCSTCMTSAGARQQQQQHDVALSATGTGNEPSSSASNDTESYIRGLRSPQHNSYEDMIFRMRESRDRDRRQSNLAMEILEAEADAELKPGNSSLKTGVSSQLLARDKMHALTDVVTNIREVRDIINLTLSEAAYGEHREETSDEIKEFNDMYSEITSIQEALESSVSNFDAALANATNAAPAMYYSGSSDRSQDSLRGDGSEQDGEMTADQLNSVARITFAAARATRQAGQAFLSVGERQNLPHEDRAAQGNQEKHEDERLSATSASVASYPTVYDSDDSSAQSPDPYSASNYEKIMATYQSEHDGSAHDDDENRCSSYNFADSVRRATEIHELEKKIFELQRSLEEAQRKLSVVGSDEPEPEARSCQRLDVVRDRSAQVEIESVFELFGERDEEKNAILEDTVSSVSLSPREVSLSFETMDSRGLKTQALVSELRGIMASSETPVRASGGSRKSLSRSPTPPLPSNVVTTSLSPLSPPPSASPPLGTGKMKLSLEDNHRHSENKPPMPKERDNLNYLKYRNGSLKTNQRGQALGISRPSAAPTKGSCLHTLDTTGSDGAYASSSSDLESHDDSSSNFSLHNSDAFREPHFKKYNDPDVFFVEEDLGALLKKRKAAEATASPPINPAASPSSPLPPAPVANIDERDELRELMASLVRRRSSSVPFQSGQMGGASSGEPLHNKPSWSDDAPDRVPTAHQVEEAVHEIHACLASCRCECPSNTERARKLTSIFKVLCSLHREGVRSKFRTLQHDDIRYSKMLKTNPSIIKLLKLAGYVSLQQKLTMRRVDQGYLALFLRELERELHSSTNA